MKKIEVDDKMQSGYVYRLSEPTGKNFQSDFNPDLTPAEMLKLGVFGGKYMTDCKDEFPKEWFENAKLSPEEADSNLNFFGVSASKSLDYWRKKGWIDDRDPRGWFQWYCRYFLGRRIAEEDDRQIKRWRGMKRHVGALQKNCKEEDLSCRPKQRQALLHWAYDSRKI